ncbi:phage tail protein [Limosilactobacillus oris]|uniref:phage tail protein n=1 Tax=Limosilactobacillus oris TaxID=1632 RepID=UPI001958AE38|nr:phage tail protein [Limosilactobacillus oris]VTX54679.1 Prophage endopeptidase tail [Limosilactobacillus oris]
MINLPTNANLNLQITNNLNNKGGDVEEYLDLNDLRDTFKINIQLNSAYEISFTATYTTQYKEAHDLLQPKRGIWFNDQEYYIQQLNNTTDENGLDQLQVTATAMLIDLMKNVRIDPAEPTEDHPETSDDKSDNSGGDQQQDPAPGTITVKKTDEQQTYTLQDRLDQFFKNNDQGIKYELHGNFPQAAVDCQGSLYEWLGSNLATFGAYYVPDNYVLKIYDIASLRRKTDHEFRYLHNTSTINLQTDATSMVNCCEVYGGKMEKDITSGGGAGGGGDLDSVEGFAKSPINADFGVNKQLMLQDFSAKDHRVHAWGVDVNRLYDTVKSQGVSPEWFFAYDITEQDPMSWSWLNHFAFRLPDPYQDAINVCNWIKQFANSDSFNPASGFGAYTSPDMAAKWNQEFHKGTIGRLYLQGTAAAVMELANENPGRYGRPMSWCVQLIKSWGGHTVHNDGADGGGWGWPFPCGEGTFLGGQLFGVQPGGGFRINGFHDGLDFGAYDHPGAEVHAIHGGKCTTGATWGGPEIKWYFVITDSTGLNVEYQEGFSNPGCIKVQPGQVVRTGDVVAIRDMDHVHIGITRMDVRAAFGHAFSNDGTWLDPQAMIKTGGNASPGGDSGSSDVTTTTQTYYSLHYTYRDEESIAKYGLQKSAPVVMDSIYDMNALKQYVEQTVQHDPPTTLTVSNISETDFNVGDVWHLVAPELNLDTDVTLMGISYNPYNPSEDASVTFNNTGVDMKNSIYAMAKDIKQMNHNVDNFDIYGSIGARKEDHFSGIDTNQTKGDDSSMKFSQNELEAIKQFTNS